MLSLRLEQFRSFEDSSQLEIKPITILVGVNSSGKSTFIRTFPLLRQSVETLTSSPLLWFGRYVDFGSFQDSLRRGSEEDEVRFSFTINTPPPDARRPNSPLSSPFDLLDSLRPSVGAFTSFEITASIRQGNAKRPSEVGRYRIRAGDMTAIVAFDQNGRVESLIVNNEDIPHSLWGSETLVRAQSAILLPSISLEKPNSPRRPPLFVPWNAQANFRMVAALAENERNIQTVALRVLALPVVKGWFHGNKYDRHILDILRRLRMGSAKQVIDAILPYVHYRPWVRSKGADDADVKALRRAIFVSKIASVLRYADREIAQFAVGVRYVGPARARGQRFYRFQELSVDEVDAQGDNLAMFVNSLEAAEREHLNRFLKKFIGVEVSSDTEKSHYALCVSGDDVAASLNLVDVGFGFSQILPIAVQIWDSCIRKTAESLPVRTLVLEQPELHLHPGLQNRVALMIADAIRSGGGKTRVVIETHSESFVNAFGRLIRGKTLSHENVGIYVFEKSAWDAPSLVRKAAYDEDGDLLNWPFGFFTPAELEILNSDPDVVPNDLPAEVADDGDDEPGEHEDGRPDGELDEEPVDEGLDDQGPDDEESEEEGLRDEESEDEESEDEGPRDEESDDEGLSDDESPGGDSLS